ncbi:hydrolase [Nocardioides sp. GY 10113]|uniref:hydrolase n=1 Tax=Nocardioides sp. GY 10113 TaxID=2569761 RepID=UPI0010A918A3|nr:hydrolase [Nocardioides sp. GY 10113]TIC88335.1 hydrolase [Nocardioides sp. GY 10113]
MRHLTVLPGVVDHHVHLGLVDRALFADSPVVEVHDLGWVIAEVAAWAADPPAGVRVRYAGPFHTAVGGYPSGRSWAPVEAVRPVVDDGDARAAVSIAAERGASRIKIALHAGMPLLGDEELYWLVRAAHETGLTAVVHAEGPGQVARAVAAGADALAHAPWTERVPDDVLADAGRRGMTWISTLAIHGPEERAVAIENIRRFRAAGGRVVHGTDLGNGPTPAGLVPEEILALGEAGLTGEDLLAAVLAPENGSGPRLAAPGPRPRDAEELVKWLQTSVRVEQETP